ncbi:MAG: hypothetical protein RLZZ241_226 [Bacteroidota bacterium]|jgi:kynurenine formamidase
MEVQIQIEGKKYRVNLSEPFDCSIPVTPNGTTAWGISGAEITPHQDGDFVGSIKAGSPVNFNTITFNPHAHGTHTEFLGHITESPYSILDVMPIPLMPVQLLSISPTERDGDLRIELEQFEKTGISLTVPAVMIRTQQGYDAVKNWSGRNPPYLDYRLAQHLSELGVVHLLLDLPSVDREQDGGLLNAHKAFWGIPKSPRLQATITELIAVPESLEDGLYLLNLQVSPFVNDASPSRPVLYRLIPD